MSDYINLVNEEDFDHIPEPEWLIGPTSRGDDGILMKETLAALVADKANFKTFLAMDWALAIANEQTEWNGHEVSPGRVLYIVGEGGRGIGRRIRAWRLGHGVPRTVASKKTAKFNIGAIPLLDDAGDGQTYTDRLLGVVQRVMPGGVDLVIIDTLSRNMGAHDENSTRDMAQLVQQGDKIKDQLGACVLFLHHVNKGGGMRGNTALPGGLDTIITMDRHTVRKVKQDKVTVHCDKQKDSEEFPDFVMKRRHIELGVDSKGAPVRSMVLDWVGYAEKDSEDAPFEPSTPEANGPLERRLGMILGSHAHDGGLTTAEWQVRAQRANVCAKTKFYELVKKMEDQGDIVSDGAGRAARWLPTKDFMTVEMAG